MCMMQTLYKIENNMLHLITKDYGFLDNLFYSDIEQKTTNIYENQIKT